jgi:site-specific recombinase XerD
VTTAAPTKRERTRAGLLVAVQRTAFSVFAATHAAASIRRAWSTWNTLCEFLYSSELIPANPMATVARPKTDKTLAKALPANAIDALLTAIDAGAGDDERRDAWAMRDRAVILTALLTGLRLSELVGLNVGDIRAVDSGAVLHVRGKGGKDRRVPVEAPLVAVFDEYLASR